MIDAETQKILDDVDKLLENTEAYQPAVHTPDYKNYMIDLAPEDRFYLPEYVKAELHNREVEFGFGLVGAVVYYRTYSRQRPDGSQEHWPDTVIRVVEGVMTIRKWWYLKNNIPWDQEDMTQLAVDMAEAIFTFKMLPPGRGLWAMGSEWMHERGSAALYNCAYCDVKDLAEDAQWTMDMLMCGVGVGHSTRFFGNPTYYQPTEYDWETNVYVIPDTREGWALSVRKLIETYSKPGKDKITFDYSEIRPAGAPIRGFGGTASGPAPLQRLHEEIRSFLDKYVRGEYSGTRLVVDVMNAIGACVVAGNVRRSAEISLGDPEDDEFIELKHFKDFEAVFACEEHGEFQQRIHTWQEHKSPEHAKCPVCNKKSAAVLTEKTDWFEDEGKWVKRAVDPVEMVKKVVTVPGPAAEREYLGWMSNNSVVIDSYDDLKELPKIAARVFDNGEPGIFNLLNIQKYGRYGEKKPDRATGANPCAEIPLESYEVCNLVETFPTKCVDENGVFSEEIFQKTLRLSTFYASTVSLLPTHSKKTNEVVERNRRIGVSLSGIADWMEAYPMTDVISWLDRGYHVVVQENEDLAHEAGVEPSVRVTTVKPSGTISLLAGVSSGMHLPPFSRYLKRIRMGMNTPLVPLLMEANVPYEMDRKSQNTVIFEFPVDQGKVRGQKDVSVWAKAQTVIVLQKFWADNMVSNTLSFDPEREGNQIEDLLTFVTPFIKTISLFPLLDEGAVYEQSPIEQITLEEVKRRQKEILPINWTKFGGSDGQDSKFCANDSCEI